MRHVAAIAMLGAIGCTSLPSAAPAPAPAVTITQLTAVAPLRMRVQGGLPVEYRIDITNPLDLPLTLTSLEIETVGETGAYALKRVRHVFSRSIKAHSVDTILLRAWVHTLQEADTGEVGNPVMVRGVAQFESAAGGRRTAFAGRVQ